MAPLSSGTAHSAPAAGGPGYQEPLRHEPPFRQSLPRTPSPAPGDMGSRAGLAEAAAAACRPTGEKPPTPEALSAPPPPVHAAARAAQGVGHEPGAGGRGAARASRSRWSRRPGGWRSRTSASRSRSRTSSGPGAFDPVTAADRGVEALIRAGLGRAWPDSPIQGEEEGFTPGASEWSWIIDPIDGTRAFISGVPAWGILLGLLKAGRPVAGIMRQPYLDETFLGGPSGAWLLRAGSRLPLARLGQGEPRRGDPLLHPARASSPTPPSRPASTGSRRRSG